LQGRETGKGRGDQGLDQKKSGKGRKKDPRGKARIQDLKEKIVQHKLYTIGSGKEGKP